MAAESGGPAGGLVGGSAAGLADGVQRDAEFGLYSVLRLHAAGDGQPAYGGDHGAHWPGLVSVPGGANRPGEQFGIRRCFSYPAVLAE